MSNSEYSRAGFSIVEVAGQSPARTYGTGRICAEEDCTTKLSRYNAEDMCYAHRTKAERADRVARAAKALNVDPAIFDEDD